MLTTFLHLKGHECIAANDGKSGIEILKNENFDAVLLDLAMPEFSGYDVIDEKEKELEKNKIIVFTASTISETELDKLVKRGVHSYLLKPTDLDDLTEMLNELMNS
jgi:DNA-binding response OmpR family regulator